MLGLTLPSSLRPLILCHITPITIVDTIITINFITVITVTFTIATVGPSICRELQCRYINLIFMEYIYKAYNICRNYQIIEV